MKDDLTLKEKNPELYNVAREGGTEPPFSSDLLHLDRAGVYQCAVCGAPLFPAQTKFESGTGWPSFTDPVNKTAVRLIDDNRHGMHRTEVRCAVCDAHLGHVFPDGPLRDPAEGSGRHDRYCINGISLELKEEERS